MNINEIITKYPVIDGWIRIDREEDIQLLKELMEDEPVAYYQDLKKEDKK